MSAIVYGKGASRREWMRGHMQATLMGVGMRPHEVLEFLKAYDDAYAHELAEKQRAFMDTALKMSPWATGRDGRPLRIDALIDLIDPEAPR